MLIYGIDPGFTGAIALYWPDTGKLEVHDMPVMKNPKGKTIINPHGVLDILANEGGKSLAVIEQVGAMPGQGVSSMFRFGEGYGHLQMACAACKLPLQYVTPATWKKHFNLSRGKSVSRGLTMQRFPDQAQQFSRAKDDGRAEAALIALYGAEKLV
jgi:crossover junction endodeoxyribonuclease RuvC